KSLIRYNPVNNNVLPFSPLEQVKVAELDSKIVGLYFSAHWCGPCRRFTPKLAEAYAGLAAQGFEVVFLSADEDEPSFGEYFSEMPWLAVPFSDSETRTRLDQLFHVNGIPHLVVLDGSTGKVLTTEGVDLVTEYGTDAFPFTPETLEKLREVAAAARRNQTVRSLLTPSSRDYVLNNKGDKVPVWELEGKTVGLYFFMSNFTSCSEFTALLRNAYEELQKMGEKFEVVVVPLDDEEEAPFEEEFGAMPWLTLPCKDKICEKLVRYFDLETLPTLVIIGPDGKTLMPNAVQLVEDHGALAHPFTPEKVQELAEIERAMAEAQTLESLLVSGDPDYVIGKNGAKVPVSELVGKNILLYFSAHWCPPCRAFLPKLIETYEEIKAKDSAFEVIFISSDEDQSSFDDFFASMPWLALPYGDKRKKSLSRRFKIHGIPALVVIGPSGRTVTKEGREMVAAYGSAAYPFTDERMKELEAEMEEMANGWPEKLKHVLHEAHELVRTRRRSYYCDGCKEQRQGFSFYCEECDFDLDPNCALKVQEEAKDADGDANPMEDDGETAEGYVCDEVCYKK
ncbi:hypothetical protein Taro_012007, partial [Colocasia esculenta]|nr:hypothetical protein [Colocasia esculenta]